MPLTSQIRRDVVAWVGSNIVPHEADLRARLRQSGIAEHEIDDVVQDAYFSIAKMDSIAHIQNGRAYFFMAARNAFLQRIRRNNVVRIDSMSELEALSIADDDPGAERRVTASQELARVHSLIAALPDRCRRIFELRRIEGVSQREIARILGVTENVVEAQAARGLKLVLQGLADADSGVKKNISTLKVSERDRKQH
jgi:RNA polymerase sigma factor (sigma-70 family)